MRRKCTNGRMPAQTVVSCPPLRGRAGGPPTALAPAAYPRAPPPAADPGPRGAGGPTTPPRHRPCATIPPWAHRRHADPMGQLEGGNIRASDRDRNSVADELRVHCLEGRITVEELEQRLGKAMSAV